MVATHPATANFICKRLYLYFASEEINDDEIKKLSKIYLENGGEIKKVLEYLFKSEHFKSFESLRFIESKKSI